MPRDIVDKIDEIFSLCSKNSLTDYPSVSKLFWPTLSNSLSLCDLSGVYLFSNIRWPLTLSLNRFSL